MKQVMFALYVAVLVVMGIATFVEAAEGTAFVHRHFYGAWWFTALWAALAIAGSAYIARYIKPSTRPGKMRGAVLLLHTSFLVILLGALLTHLTGRSGTIHLRLNEPQDIAEMEHNGRKHLQHLDFWIELTDFQIIEDKEGETTDYRSSFRILQKSPTTHPHCQEGGQGDETIVVSMNNISVHDDIRFYQMSYDYDLQGSTLMLNRDPYGIPVTYCGYALLFISFIGLCLKRTGSLRIWLSSIALTTVWCVYYFVLDGSWTQVPVLRHPLLFAHVIVIIMAYALLLIQTLASATWLVKNRRGKPLPLAPRRECWRVRLSLCLLSIGIFLGAIWANISWGNYWSWDSKEVWALITMMVYAVPLHQTTIPAFRKPLVFHAYLLLAFLTVLMTYFGVSYMLTGMHSYT